MDNLLVIALGLGLAAAAGLRVFVPLLATGFAAHSGVIQLSPGFAWLDATPTLAILAVATVAEIGAYLVPWLDHALDAIASPLAVLAGMLVSASVLVDMPPALKWSLVIIGGGGAAAVMQAGTVMTRLKSGLATAGLANPLVGIAEAVGAVLLSAIAIFAPMAFLLLVAALGVLPVRRMGGAPLRARAR